MGRGRNVTYHAGFDEFWGAYPRKVAKQPAFVQWQRISPSPELRDRILADVKARSVSRDWVKDGGTFIPYPSTYLNQRRWEDEGVVIPPTEVTPISVDPTLCVACGGPAVPDYPWCEEHKAYRERACGPLQVWQGRTWNRAKD